jgi:AcrR family transcriptional regulator
VPTPRRRDARRNRSAILRVADEALTRGTDPTPLPEIARLAGVGRATVYRHFPDRGELALAVMDEQLAGLGRLVEDRASDPAAFGEVLHAVLTAQATMRPLVTLLRELSPTDRRRNADRLVDALTPSLREAQAAGLAHGDLEPRDLRLVFAMLEAAVATTAVLPDAEREAVLGRAIRTLVEGVCPSRP